MLNEVRNLQQVTCLCVDWTNEFLNECWSVVFLNSVVWEVSPSWIYSENLVLTTAVNGSIVHVDNVLTLLAVRLHDELLHLLDGKVNGDNLRDAEECRLEDGVGAVAQTNLLCNLGGVDIIYLDVLLGEHALHLVRNEVDELLAVEDSVQKERTVLADTTCDVVHVQVSLYVASHEVRCGDLIGRADRLVAETEVRASETTRLLRVVREVSLAVLVGVLTDNLN